VSSGEDAKELSQILSKKIAGGALNVAVRPDPSVGWRAYVVTAPDIKHQRLVDRTAVALRKQGYKLKA
jgi:hypothetical protein